ncbi:hypothetical protein DMA11_19185 [Marinilabiliaceae bacterium JC017]|nr:hypothetical protein DMA11_19185 [Marinilabiliaceae bacterium JC017]
MITLKGEDFLRLFCQHILSQGFIRIRHYGFLSSASKVKSLVLIRKNLGVTPTEANTAKTWQEVVFDRMGINPGICRCCGGKMELVDSWPNKFRQRQRASPPEAAA